MKEDKYDLVKSRDSQFEIWKISGISESKKLRFSLAEARHKVPTRLPDADVLLDEISFPTGSMPRKMRGLHLSLKQTKILATLLPNAIINISDLAKESIDTFVGVLLFADVSGFTALCEKYNGFGKSGSDKLSATLNNYLGAMVEVIYKHGGDVLKFSGDAILALWKLENNEYMYSLIHRVISCALFIQNTLGEYETEVKILLKVKLAISAGNMTFSVIGNDTSRHYVIVGSPVFEVKSAERACTSGEVILSFSAWGHLSPVNYEHSWKDDEHVKVVRIIYNPENLKREILRTDIGSLSKSDILSSGVLKAVETYKKKYSVTSATAELRVVVEEVSKRNLSSELRSFVIPSVIQQIDADLPLEYLSEMRNVTIMFVNIVPNQLHSKRLINMVDKAYVIICSLAYKAMGTVNKVSLFDKDVMILVIFGLRGFSHEGEVAGCLRCGYDIKHACSSLDGVFSVSVGVTTGQAYCGVVGHPMRREYTVIGAVVNKAARIMCAYPGKVTCDRDTFVFSNLASSFFTIQEKRYLKGIEDTGPIYEFTLEKSKNTLAAMHDGMYPILGREKEVEIFQNVLRALSNSNTTIRAICIRGVARIGKTRLLDEMILDAHKKGFLPIVVALHSVHSSLPYSTAQSIIRQTLEIPDSAGIMEREQRLSFVLRNHVPLRDFWYLNEVMNVKFPRDTEHEPTLNQDERLEKIKKLFHILLTTGSKSLILTVDNAEFCDEMSWKLLMGIIENKTKFLIMSMLKRTRLASKRILNIPPEVDTYILKLKITGLPDEVLPSLACQLLNARAVPMDLVRILVEKSSGNPGWCESFLLSLSQSNVLKVEELPLWHVKNLNLLIPPESDLKRKQYAVVTRSDLLEENEKSASNSYEVQEDKEGDKTTKSDELRKQHHKVNFVKIPKGWDGNHGLFDFAIGQSYKFPRTTPLQIEEAYEDFRQRLQMVRLQTKLAGRVVNEEDTFDGSLPAAEQDDIRTHHWALADDYDKLSESQSLTNLTRIRSLEAVVDLTEFFREAEEDESSKQESDTSLKEKITDILRRYSPSSLLRRQSTSEKRDSLVLRSLENFQTVSVKSTVNKARSAEAIIELREQITSRGTSSVQREVAELEVDDEFQFLPSSLWKSHTQDLIDESIQIFAQKKGRRGNEILRKSYWQKKKSGQYHSMPSTSLTPLNVNVKINKDVNPSVWTPISSQQHEKLTVMRDQLERAEKERTKSFGRKVTPIASEEPLHKVKVTEEIPDDEQIPNGTESVTLPGEDRLRLSDSFEGRTRQSFRKLKISKMFEWMKRRSNAASLSDLSLDLPTQLDESNELLPAILVDPRINLQEVAAPECFVRVIMTAFDCLRPYEQLMLKCASILGEKFSRKMLNSIMHNPNPVLMAEATKRLFEMQLLCCASEEDQKEDKPRLSASCQCSLSSADVVDDILPRYSYCRFLMFKYAAFRSTLYELIPLDQKREFHIRAVAFLEMEKTHCPSCKMIAQSDRKFVNSFLSATDQRTTYQENFQRSSSTSTSRSTNQTILSAIFESGGKILKSEPWNTKNEMPALSLPTLLPNFQSCECLVLQADNLKQLVNHSIAAGIKEKEIEFIIQYSSVMIYLGEFREARKLLSELYSKMKLKAKALTLNRKGKRFFLGRITLLLGGLNLEVGSAKEAYFHLMTASRYFGSHFVTFGTIRCIQYMYEYIRQAILQKSNPLGDPEKSKNQQSARDYRAMCLSLLCNVFMLQNKWELARLVSLRSLNILRSTNDNFIELCNAYSNAIDVHRHLGDFKYCRKLEIAVSKSYVAEFPCKTALEVIAVGRLNCSLLNARLISGCLQAAAKLGDSAVQISQSISSNKIESYIISKVSHAMLLVGKLNRAAGLILHLPIQNIWHYILSLDFILETGFAIENSDTCLDAILNVLDSDEFIDFDVRRRALSTVYVWMARLGKYEEAKVWSKKLTLVPQSPLTGEGVSNMITVLKILEGDLLTLASSNVQELRNSPMHKKIGFLIRALEKSTKRAEVMIPRFLHLRAYYHYRINNLSKALMLLSDAKKMSIRHGNVLERSWISHSKKVWTNTCEFDKDIWVTSAQTGNMMKWTANHDLTCWKNYMYSLKYFEN